MTTPITLDQLLDERAIARAIIAFAVAMDERDWDGLRSLMAPDMTADLGTGDLDGPDAVVGLIRSFLDACGPTQHLIGNVRVEVDGDTASSEAYVRDMHKGLGDWADTTFETLGNYLDRWRRVDGTWKMVHRTKRNRAQIGDMSIFAARA